MTSTNHTRPESNNHTPWTPDSASLAWMSTPPPPSGTGPESDERQETAPTETRPVPESSPVSASRGEASVRADTPAPARVSAPSASAPPRPAPTPPPAPAPERPAEHYGAAGHFPGGHPEPFVNAVRSRATAPKQGWRAALYRATGLNPGLSRTEELLIGQQRKIRTPMDGSHSVMVSSLKGGVGKTTVSALLALFLAEGRGERVVAVDANPDAGTLGDRLVGETEAAQLTVRKLLNNLDQIRSFSDLSRYVHLVNRLQVVTSEQEPESSEAFSQKDYEAIVSVLSRFCQVLVTDSGTGITHSAMQGGLARCDSLVIVGSLTQDAASRAAKTLNWLASRQWSDLAKKAVVVLSQDRDSTFIDKQPILDHFQERCRAVLTLPPDPHLQAGGQIDLDALKPATRAAAREIAATVAEGFYGCPTSLGRAAGERRTDVAW
ncbi:MinD/ParA family protein [Pseudonocardia nantongensis]|uniref:MinD/ParA family ATP-binding protein n=1 Tax=Pseudonocardia nantongensis TaxID=1181885 RepID=UPI00397E5AF9